MPQLMTAHTSVTILHTTVNNDTLSDQSRRGLQRIEDLFGILEDLFGDLIMGSCWWKKGIKRGE